LRSTYRFSYQGNRRHGFVSIAASLFDNSDALAQTANMPRWATMFVALLLASALGTSTLASCMADVAAAPQTRMACCAHGHDKCPMHRSLRQSATDCCQHDSQRQHALTAAEQQPIHTAVTFRQIAAVTPHAPISITADSTISARYSSRSTSPPTPRPALSAVLLI
jgi:hypothetical protein